MFGAAPDPGWIPFLKLGFGFVLLLIMGALSLAIALGHVEMSTSYGLNIILGGMLTLGGAFAGWAFKEVKGGKDEHLRDLCGGDETLHAKVISLLEAWGTIEGLAKNSRTIAE